MTRSSTSDRPTAGRRGSAEPLPTLSVVIPVYNAAEWVGPTVAKVESALDRAGWDDAEVVIVDDGSSDGSDRAIGALECRYPLVVVSQANEGRFPARMSGLEAAHGEFVLLVDIRVHVDEDALLFLADRLQEEPSRRAWNGDVRTAVSWKPWTRFWNPITFVAWRRYLHDPVDTSYGTADFDHYPKGTGFFFAPRLQLLELCKSFDSSFDDISMASDDTLLLRPLAESDRINIAPGFSAVYFPRDDVRSFMRHTYFRGTTFVDGHLRPGSRFNRLFWATVLLAPIPACVTLLRPRQTAAAAGAGLASLPLILRAAGVPLADGASFAVLLPVFSVTYAAGVVRGLRLRRHARKTTPLGR